VDESDPDQADSVYVHGSDNVGFRTPVLSPGSGGRFRSGIGTSATNNYISPNFTALTNWSTTDRIDYNLSSKDTLSFLAAIGRQASAVPQGQTTSGRNIGPVPYNYGQAFTPKTAVGVIEETHVFSPELREYYSLETMWGDAPKVRMRRKPAAPGA